MKPLPLIPTPPALRWREFRIKAIPGLVFAAALITAAALWQRYVSAPTALAQVELIQANVVSTKPGTLTQLQVDRFMAVRAHDPVATVITTDPRILETSLAVIRAEAELLRVGMTPVLDQERNELTYQRVRLELLDARVQLAQARIRQHYAESELARIATLYQDHTNIVSQNAYEIALRDRDALRAEVEEKTKLIAEGERGLQRLRQLDPAQSSTRGEDTLRAAIAVQEERLHQTEAQLSPLTLYAPIQGMVSMVYRRSGENIVAGEPLLTITSTNFDRAIGYVRAPCGVDPQVNMRVEVRSRSFDRVRGIGKVIAVGGHLEPLPAVFLPSSPGKVTDLGLPLTITLPPGLKLRPGELVDVRLLP